MADDGEDCQNLGPKERPKVIIIGAGIAGVGAGCYLTNHGFHDFVILEATNRIGGRIHTVDLETVNGRKAELGANWIHGIERNPIFKLAIENNLLTPQYQPGRKLGQKVMFKTEGGDPVYTKIVEEVDWTFGMLMAKCEEFYQDHLPTPMENDSVGSFLEREFEHHLHGLSCPKLRRMIFRHRLLGESVISGCDSMWDVSLSEVGSFEELPGVHYVIPPGFQSAVSILRRDIPDSQIRLNHVVTEVNWKPSSTGAATNSGGVKVTCSNGNIFHADMVLCTIPLGYLKKYAGRLFNPQLPEFKTEAIESIAMGTVNKMLIEFDDVVLPDGVRRLELIWDIEGVDMSDLKNNWFKKIGSFEAVEDNVLIGWICGREADYMESLEEEDVKRQCLDVLSSFLPTKTLPAVKRFTRSAWRKEQYTLGSYCYIPVGGSAEDIERLADPVHDEDDKPVLLFAGEACHPTFYSSSHGALLSGEKEAQRLLDLMAGQQHHAL